MKELSAAKDAHHIWGVRAPEQDLALSANGVSPEAGFPERVHERKLRSDAREGLIGFKHFMETGEVKPNRKRLKKKPREF
ncbi:MAG: hypothetical protein K5905_29785 [Roseibium sp.]|uniref:hypothetical protein n=1 Tax=Roseibium sp. TaxID=1936156 RepID=UPI0026058627|nr:hypothetical protein [Roseibium sp.]MCV0429653.1 hypothetical protein [Roseibium sp.]